MSDDTPATFERDQSISETDWLRSLPGAVRDHPLVFPASGAAVVTIGSGALELNWTKLPPRRLGLVPLPRLAICYRFDGVDAEARRAFMRYFDLYTHRGGG